MRERLTSDGIERNNNAGTTETRFPRSPHRKRVTGFLRMAALLDCCGKDEVARGARIERVSPHSKMLFSRSANPGWKPGRLTISIGMRQAMVALLLLIVTTQSSPGCPS